tara:strand:- start:52 stop:489 length:438 start_codon:yes stop_codon:yes gene_type:complete
MKFKSKIYIDYDDILSMCHNITYDVSKIKPDIIVGITRGGLLPALHLSHHLERPMMTIQWQTRDANKCEHNIELQSMIDKGKTVVFVDDINDTGRTFEEISKAYHCERPNVFFISLVKKTETRYNTTAALSLEDERWIVFPWEKD